MLIQTPIKKLCTFLFAHFHYNFYYLHNTNTCSLFPKMQTFIVIKQHSSFFSLDFLTLISIVWYIQHMYLISNDNVEYLWKCTSLHIDKIYLCK